MFLGLFWGVFNLNGIIYIYNIILKIMIEFLYLNIGHGYIADF